MQRNFASHSKNLPFQPLACFKNRRKLLAVAPEEFELMYSVIVAQSSAATNNNAVWCLAANEAETCIAVSLHHLLKLYCTDSLSFL